MSALFLRGFLIGLVFGVPVGAVGALTVQRTLYSGRTAGFVTGLGSSVADCLYAAAGVFGLSFISGFLLRYQTPVNITGSVFILCMGISLLFNRRKHDNDRRKPETAGTVKMFLSSFVVGITNPAAVLTFLFAFSYFKVPAHMALPGRLLLIAGIFCGTYFWWTFLTLLSAAVKKRGTLNYRTLNRIFGCLLVLFALVVAVRTFAASASH